MGLGFPRAFETQDGSFRQGLTISRRTEGSERRMPSKVGPK